MQKKTSPDAILKAAATRKKTLLYNQAALEKSSQLTKLVETPASVVVNQGVLKYSFNLPRQAVSLLVVEW